MDRTSRTLIIAEAGVNHNGDITIAKQMIDCAKEAGADIVKFQTGMAENVVSKFAQKAEYQKIETGCEENQLDMLKKLQLPFEQFRELKAYCDKVGITFLSTPFDLESIDFLNTLDMKFWKVPSGEITNYPYLVQIAKTKKKVLMSTGMCEMQEIEEAIDVLKKNGCTDIMLLHCNTEYPTPMCDVNLNAMISMREKFRVPVGYSDHTKGIEVAIAAVTMGATVIEKHFTLDRNMEGPDHKASLEPDELKAMVKAIRNIEIAIGSSEKKVTASEEKNRAIARKSIVAKRHIDKGETFTVDNITTKRPGSGISPMKWNVVLGRKAMREFEEDELIEIVEE